MKDRRGRIIYVGKARSLRSRVASYFQDRRALNPRTQLLVRNIDDLDTIVTPTELDALLLEFTLIKRHHPYFNVQFRDDKKYPYLELTLGEPFPRMQVVRRPTQAGSRLFGPYANAGALRHTVKLMMKLFNIRTCALAIPGTYTRPCLDYYLHQCTAPCTNYISREAYGRSVEDAIRFLEGRTRQVLARLRRDMEAAAETLEFERAARVREAVFALEQVAERQRMVCDPGTDEDTLAVVEGQASACVQVLQVRDGALTGEHHFLLANRAGESAEELLSAFLGRYYGESGSLPSRVLLDRELPDREILEGWLTAQAGMAVALQAPKSGPRTALLTMARRNAALRLAEAGLADQGALRHQEGLLALRDALGLAALPVRMECFDISNIQGRQPVASMVVFLHGKPARSHYRRFRIRSQETPDDYRMMEEVLRRRLSGALDEDAESKRKYPALPDLLLVDGGKGQLGVAVRVLAELGVTGVPVAGLAKEQELVLLPGRADPLRLPRDSPALHLLQGLRDEAHRFAVTYHRTLRGRTMSWSRLETVEGVGPIRKRTLLRHFRSIQALAAAPAEEIAALPGCSQDLALRILAALAPAEGSDPTGGNEPVQEGGARE